MKTAKIAALSIKSIEETLMNFGKLLTLGLVILISGCATPYQNSAGAFTGGWDAKNLEGEVYRVSFYGNGYTSEETVQTYWLYKCAEVAIENGFDGFEILSHISLTKNIPVEDLFKKDPIFKKAQVYYVPMDSGPKPHITADILLLKSPLEGQPPKVFDAPKLKEALNDFVTGEKCSMDNVCEHVHKYIHPEGKFDAI